MATTADIQAKIDIGKSYLIEQTAIQLDKMKKGCGSLKDVNAIKRVIRGLEWQVIAEVVDNTTLSLYKCLVSALGGYGGTYTIDPNVVIPGEDIVVINNGDYNDGIITFNGTDITIANYQSLYYPLYGNNPNLSVWTGSGGSYTEDLGTAITKTYVGGDIASGIESFSVSYPVPTQGYFTISGKEPI